MATRWIKVETCTPEKPELRQIARLCHCSKADAFLAFFRFFVWADEQTEDGWVRLMTPTDVDEVALLSGFGTALQEVRWVDFDTKGMQINNWDRHNGQSAKRRAMDAERKRGVREMSASYTDKLRTKSGHSADVLRTREEKRRGE